MFKIKKVNIDKSINITTLVNEMSILISFFTSCKFKSIENDEVINNVILYP